jgi:hypothetical protein
MAGFRSGRERFARQLSYHRGAPRVLFSFFQIARGEFNSNVGRARVAVTGFVTLVWQTWLGFTVSTGQGLTIYQCVGWGLNPKGRVFSHQISQKMSNAIAGTPSSQAMKYLPMMFSLKW